MHGTLDRHGDRWTLTFVRRLPHPPEKVWRALTEPEHLAAWFPSEIHGERAAGAPLRFVFAHGEGPPTEGEMLTYDPPSVLEYRWEQEVLRFHLRPEGDGCVLTFVDTFDELGKAARDGAGWHACLDVLEHHLAGTEPPWTPQGHWSDVHAGYVERFGPEAATIGPPEGAFPSE
ncbi:MAG: SRPBCC family protein [Acidimicrobiales bacterium]